MDTNADIPDEFREEVFQDYIRIITGCAIIGAQYVERVFNAICLALQPEGLRFSIEDFMSGDSSRTRQTLGLIEQQLRKSNLFDLGFSERLQEFARRRNRVVHGLFVDTFKSKEEISFRSELAQE